MYVLKTFAYNWGVHVKVLLTLETLGIRSIIGNNNEVIPFSQNGGRDKTHPIKDNQRILKHSLRRLALGVGNGDDLSQRLIKQ